MVTKWHVARRFSVGTLKTDRGVRISQIGGCVVEQVMQFKYVVASIVYSALGIGILVFSCYVFDALTPGNMWEDIVKEKNLPLAVALGAMLLAVGQIVASAIHG